MDRNGTWRGGCEAVLGLGASPHARRDLMDALQRDNERRHHLAQSVAPSVATIEDRAEDLRRREEALSGARDARTFAELCDSVLVVAIGHREAAADPEEVAKLDEFVEQLRAHNPQVRHLIVEFWSRLPVDPMTGWHFENPDEFIVDLVRVTNRRHRRAADAWAVLDAPPLNRHARRHEGDEPEPSLPHITRRPARCLRPPGTDPRRGPRAVNAPPTGRVAGCRRV